MLVFHNCPANMTNQWRTTVVRQLAAIMAYIIKEQRNPVKSYSDKSYDMLIAAIPAFHVQLFPGLKVKTGPAVCFIDVAVCPHGRPRICSANSLLVKAWLCVFHNRAGRVHAVCVRHFDVSLWQWFYDLLSSLHLRTPKCRATVKRLPDQNFTLWSNP